MAVHRELIEVAHSEDVVGSLVARMLQKSVVIAILGALEDAISRMAPWLCRIENWAEHRSLRGRLYVGGRRKNQNGNPN
jgi:hypothetical protein